MLGASRAAILGASNADGTQYAVGSFDGQSAAGNQAVTGVGFTPKAIIFWGAPFSSTSGSWAANIYQTIGFTSGPTESYSVSGFSLDGAATSETSRRSAAKCISMPTGGAGVYFEADLASFDSDGFTVNWTDQIGNSGHQFMFLAIGGDDVSAKVVNWLSPTAVGNGAVTGVGFQPDVVLHAGVGATAMPESTSELIVAIGAADAAGNQWTNAVRSGAGLATSDTERYQRTDKVFALTSNGSVFRQASHVSMDADGFTTNWDVAGSPARQMVSLCLSGVSAKVGNFAKTTAAAPASQSITGVGFKPSAVLTSNISSPAITTVASHSAWGLAGSDGTTARSVNEFDADALSTTAARTIWDGYFIAGTGAAQAYQFAADLTSLDADGFTVNFTTNDGSSDEIIYLALG